MKKQIILNDRDLYLFRFLIKYRLAASRAIFLACGFPSMNYATIRLKKLADYGYIKKHTMYFGMPIFYTLKHIGITILEEKTREYNPAYSTALHYIGVADVGAYLAHRYHLDAIDSFFVDRDFYSDKSLIEKFKIGAHKPDLIFKVNNDVFFAEYERSRKRKKVIQNNILANYLSCNTQIWVIGDIRFNDIIKENKEDIIFLKHVDIVEGLKKKGGSKLE